MRMAPAASDTAPGPSVTIGARGENPIDRRQTQTGDRNLARRAPAGMALPFFSGSRHFWKVQVKQDKAHEGAGALRCAVRQAARSFMDAPIGAGGSRRGITAGASTRSVLPAVEAIGTAGPWLDQPRAASPRKSSRSGAGWNGRQKVLDAGCSKVDPVTWPTLGVVRSGRAPDRRRSRLRQTCKPACTRAAGSGNRTREAKARGAMRVFGMHFAVVEVGVPGLQQPTASPNRGARVPLGVSGGRHRNYVRFDSVQLVNSAESGPLVPPDLYAFSCRHT
jgi:hypothetical protein